MNAILVFDPSNDLVFAKSNKLFRTRVLRYSKLQGLIASAGTGVASNSASSSSSSSSSSQSSSPCSELSTEAGRNLNESLLQRKRRRRRASLEGGHLLNTSNGRLDTNKKYLEILMLLLTPYVASLRLSGLIRQQQRAALKSMSPSSQFSLNSTSSKRKSSNGDLLSKFMSSIQVNHEARIDDAAATRTRFGQDNDYDYDLFDDDGGGGEGTDTGGKAHHEFTPRRFSQFQMPVECLSDCQIVYCELFDFIFVHMQQLEQVSSFKMRLLQKRIDLFARLALLLFGPSLNSMRDSSNGNNCQQQQQQVDQGRILRQVYDVWLEHQFEPEFLLEANERLMVGRSIEQHCRETLRKISVHLRRCSSHGETHMHALLYSDTKLAGQFSCRNSQSLNDDDLVLLLLLLKTYNVHHNNELNDANDDCRSGPPMAPTYCYSSNFNTNKRTSEIYPTPPGSSPSLSTGNLSAKSGPMQRQRRRRFHHRQQLKRSRSPSESQMSSEATSGGTGKDDKLPSQFLIFLSTPGKFKDRLRVPHMLRLVPLARGVTLIIISEISTSYLSLQLNRVLKILVELTDPVALAGEAATPALPPPPAVSTKTDAVRPTRQPKPLAKKLEQEQRQRPLPSASCQVKLSQLAKINDCVCAIKSYFNGQNYDLIDHHQHSVVGVQPNPNANSYAQTGGQQSRDSPASACFGSSDCATAAKQQQRSQSNLVNLLGRWYFGGGSNKPAGADQTQASGGKGQSGTGAETEGLEPDFELRCNAKSGAKTVYETLDERARRQCCQLVCRLEDLVSSNMHTYMRRTFNLPVEERKRQALLNTVALVLRESLDTFVFQPQMCLLNDQRGSYVRLYSELIDQVRLIAGEHLSDYLDYLAVKATCNVTLGAPLTHDMPALRSFIYVDRSRHEMLVSPMMHNNCSKIDRDSMLEVDFRSPIAHRSALASSNGLKGSESSSSESSLGEESSEADESSSASSSGSMESVIYRPSSKNGMTTIGAPQAPILQGKNKVQQPVATIKIENCSSSRRRAKSQWLIGTSGDLVTANELCGSSSGHSSSLTNMTSSYQSNIGFQHHQRHKEGKQSNSGEDYGIDELAHAASLPSVHLVDETLMKGFTCFIYNRLAKGKTSFTSNDVAELEAGRKLAIARRLEANYKSMPSVVCGDFFGSYARTLFGDVMRSNDNKPNEARRPHKLVEVACRFSELDTCTGNRLVRRRLSQLREDDMDDEASEDDELSENDFGLFLRNLGASKTTRLPRFTIERQTGSTTSIQQSSDCSDKVKVKVKVKKRAEAQNGPECYELFCVHQASLLVHRRQVLVEAERLAQRLAQLCKANDED